MSETLVQFMGCATFKRLHIDSLTINLQ
jgi:hypothetical protein